MLLTLMRHVINSIVSVQQHPMCYFELNMVSLTACSAANLKTMQLALWLSCRMQEAEVSGKLTDGMHLLQITK